MRFLRGEAGGFEPFEPLPLEPLPPAVALAVLAAEARLREVGCFNGSVVIEGFSGGLDVLAGNNELGKSTIFRAMRTALTKARKASIGSAASYRAPRSPTREKPGMTAA